MLKTLLLLGCLCSMAVALKGSDAQCFTDLVYQCDGGTRSISRCSILDGTYDCTDGTDESSFCLGKLYCMLQKKSSSTTSTSVQMTTNQ